MAIAYAMPGTGLAQSQSEPWRFRAQVYVWLPAVDGEARFPPSGGGVAAQVDMSDYFSLDNFQGAFMGTLEARKGRWGGFSDFIYLHFHQDESVGRDFTLTSPGGGIEIPVGASVDAGLRLKGWEWTLAGTYAMVQRPGYELQALAGLRYLRVDATLDWSVTGSIGTLPPQAASGRLTSKPDYWDGIVGVRGRMNLGQSRWFIPYHLDVGTGQSDLTWQGVAGVGYDFRWGELLGVYRHLYYRFPSTDPLRNLTFSGPAVSLAFKW